MKISFPSLLAPTFARPGADHHGALTRALPLGAPNHSEPTYMPPFVHMTSSTTSRLACAMSCMTASPLPPV